MRGQVMALIPSQTGFQETLSVSLEKFAPHVDGVLAPALDSRRHLGPAQMAASGTFIANI